MNTKKTTKKKAVKKKAPKKSNAGRQEKKIDWDLVAKFLEAGCLGTGIAAYIGIHPNTLYERCKKDNNCDFGEYTRQKRSKGESLLRAKQHQVAMAGDKTMLVWLGKNRLGQRDRFEHEVSVKEYKIGFGDALDPTDTYGD